MPGAEAASRHCMAAREDGARYRRRHLKVAHQTLSESKDGATPARALSQCSAGTWSGAALAAAFQNGPRCAEIVIGNSGDSAGRRPEDGTLYQIVRDYVETSRAQAASLRNGEGLPGFVDQEFRDLLRCGWLAGGFARFRHNGCGLDRLVPFSCKGLGLCTSCGGRRMAERAAHLADHVFPDVPARQPRWGGVGAEPAASPAIPTGVGPRSVSCRGRRVRARGARLAASPRAGRGHGGWPRRCGGRRPTVWWRAQSERARSRARVGRGLREGKRGVASRRKAGTAHQVLRTSTL